MNGDELKPWELRIQRWLHNHPRVADRIDAVIEAPTLRRGEPWWWWAALMFMVGVLGPLLIAVAALVLFLIFGHPWNWVAVSFAAVAVICTLATCVIGCEDRAAALGGVNKP